MPECFGVPEVKKKLNWAEVKKPVSVVDLFGEAPPGLGPFGVPVGIESYHSSLPEGIHSYLRGCHKADDTTIVRRGEHQGKRSRGDYQTKLKYFTIILADSKT